jgi:hypothetical protein
LPRALQMAHGPVEFEIGPQLGVPPAEVARGASVFSFPQKELVVSTVANMRYHVLTAGH